MGNANSGKKGDQIENGKKKIKRLAHRWLLNFNSFVDAFKH